VRHSSMTQPSVCPVEIVTVCNSCCSLYLQTCSSRVQGDQGQQSMPDFIVCAHICIWLSIFL
jgi:hypothetical protein